MPIYASYLNQWGSRTGSDGLPVHATWRLSYDKLNRPARSFCTFAPFYIMNEFQKKYLKRPDSLGYNWVIPNYRMKWHSYWTSWENRIRTGVLWSSGRQLWSSLPHICLIVPTAFIHWSHATMSRNGLVVQKRMPVIIGLTFVDED